jgi:uncharacterized protein (DUF983 family)
MFKHSALSFKFTQMYERCPNCNLKYEVEPAFFFGAMYISYAFSVAMFVTISLTIFILGNDPPFWWYLVAIFSAVIITLPFSFRYSRVLMLHLFGGVSFREDTKQKN